MTNSKISVITICYNAKASIAKTIESVLEQDYRPLQYVIIDGQSKDGTLELVKEYTNKFDEIGVDFLVISENDSGIYNAMNKGIKYATGEWIIYMNSDDSFYSQSSLSKMSKELSNLKNDVVYGDECVFNNNGLKFVNKRYGDISQITKTLPFCHQSSLVRRKWLAEHPFDENLKIVADYEFFLYCYTKGAVFKHCDNIVASYYRDGTSYKQYKLAIDESFYVKGKYGILDCNNIGLKIKKELRKVYTAFKMRVDK